MFTQLLSKYTYPNNRECFSKYITFRFLVNLVSRTKDVYLVSRKSNNYLEFTGREVTEAENRFLVADMELGAWLEHSPSPSENFRIIRVRALRTGVTIAFLIFFLLPTFPIFLELSEMLRLWRFLVGDDIGLNTVP